MALVVGMEDGYRGPKELRKEDKLPGFHLGNEILKILNLIKI
jgi:hypothetical protein